MAFCTNCGNALTERAKFCTSCGQPVLSAEPQPQPPSVETLPTVEPPAPIEPPQWVETEQAVEKMETVEPPAPVEPPQWTEPSQAEGEFQPVEPPSPAQPVEAPEQEPILEQPAQEGNYVAAHPPQQPGYYAQPNQPPQSYYAQPGQPQTPPQQNYYAQPGQPQTPPQSYYAQPNQPPQSYYAQPGVQHSGPSYQTNPADIAENKGICVLSYLGIFLLIPLLTKPHSGYVKYHSNQGLVLLIFSVVVSLLSMIPYLGWYIIAPIGSVFILVCLIMGIVNTVNGQMKPLPLIGAITLIQ